MRGHDAHRRSSRALVAFVVATALVASGCGEDGSAGSDAATEPAPSTTVGDTPTFCAAAGDLLQALGSGGDPAPALSAAVAAAPGSVGEHLEEMGQRLGEAGASGDDLAFLDDDLRAIASTAQDEIASTCDYQRAELVATDHAFGGLPATLDPGPTAFHLTNDGDEVHEAILYRRAEGTEGSLIDVVNGDPTISDGRLEQVATMLPAAPGEQSTLLDDLAPGDYVLVCFVPLGTTSMDQIRAGEGDGSLEDHRSKGMIGAFTVG